MLCGGAGDQQCVTTGVTVISLKRDSSNLIFRQVAYRPDMPTPRPSSDAPVAAGGPPTPRRAQLAEAANLMRTLLRGSSAMGRAEPRVYSLTMPGL